MLLILQNNVTALFSHKLFFFLISKLFPHLFLSLSVSCFSQSPKDNALNNKTEFSARCWAGHDFVIFWGKGDKSVGIIFAFFIFFTHNFVLSLSFPWAAFAPLAVTSGIMSPFALQGIRGTESWNVLWVDVFKDRPFLSELVQNCSPVLVHSVFFTPL